MLAHPIKKIYKRGIRIAGQSMAYISRKTGTGQGPAVQVAMQIYRRRRIGRSQLVAEIWILTGQCRAPIHYTTGRGGSYMI